MTFQFIEDMIDSDFIDAIKAHPVASQHYESIVGSSEPLLVVDEDGEAVSPSSAPNMKMVAEHLTVPSMSFILGDLYVGEIDGHKALAFHFDSSGLYIITA